MFFFLKKYFYICVCVRTETKWTDSPVRSAWEIEWKIKNKNKRKEKKIIHCMRACAHKENRKESKKKKKWKTKLQQKWMERNGYKGSVKWFVLIFVLFFLAVKLNSSGWMLCVFFNRLSRSSFVVSLFDAVCVCVRTFFGSIYHFNSSMQYKYRVSDTSFDQSIWVFCCCYSIMQFVYLTLYSMIFNPYDCVVLVILRRI